MIAFTEIVGDEFGHRPAEMAFTERDHLAQALLLDRPHDLWLPETLYAL